MKLFQRIGFGLVLTLLVSAPVMANQSQSLSQKLLKPVIAMQCGSELESSKLWKGAAFFMTAQQKKDNQKAICECVSEHAMDNMKATDLVKAAISEADKNKLVNQAVMNSIRGCVADVLK